MFSEAVIFDGVLVWLSRRCWRTRKVPGRRRRWSPSQQMASAWWECRRSGRRSLIHTTPSTLPSASSGGASMTLRWRRTCKWGWAGRCHLRQDEHKTQCCVTWPVVIQNAALAWVPRGQAVTPSFQSFTAYTLRTTLYFYLKVFREVIKQCTNLYFSWEPC